VARRPTPQSGKSAKVPRNKESVQGKVRKYERIGRMPLREISRLASGTRQATLLWFIWYETPGRPYAYTRGRQSKAQDYTEYGLRAKVRLRPPEFSWQVQASIRAVEERSRYRCVQELHRIFRSALAPLPEGQEVELKGSMFFGPIVDFAVELYDAEAKTFLEIDAPNGDFNSFEASSGIMILCVPEGMLPKRAWEGVVPLSPIWADHAPQATVGDLLRLAWNTFDHPLADTIDARMKQLIKTIEEDSEANLWDSIRKLLALRHSYWVAEAANACRISAVERASKEKKCVKSKIGRQLARLRQEAKIPWRKVAEGSGVAERQLYAIAYEGASPTNDTLRALDGYFSRLLKRPVSFQG
jgi:hypothetical protein